MFTSLDTEVFSFARNTGTCSLPVRREAERHIWRAPSAWKLTYNTSRPNMFVCPTSSLNWRLLGTKEHTKKFKLVMLIRFSSSLMNGFFLSLRRLSSMISRNSFTEGERNPPLSFVHSMIHADGMTSSAVMTVHLLKPSSTGLSMMPTKSISYRLTQRTIRL